MIKFFPSSGKNSRVYSLATCCAFSQPGHSLDLTACNNFHNLHYNETVRNITEDYLLLNLEQQFILKIRKRLLNPE